MVLVTCSHPAAYQAVVGGCGGPGVRTCVILMISVPQVTTKF